MPKKINLTIIQNQYLPKQFFMNQNKRLTRSTSSMPPLNSPPNQMSKQELVLRKMAGKDFKSGKFDSAIRSLQLCQTQDHWVNCMKAQSFFQVEDIKACVRCLCESWNYEFKNCRECFNLLLQVVEKNRPNIKIYQKAVKKALRIENLQYQLKSQLQSINQQIILTKHMRTAKQKDFRRLQQYYQNNGLKFKKIQIIEEGHEYRVVRAKNTIRPNQIIISVPYKQMITLQVARSLPDIIKLSQEESRLRSPKHCILSIFLLLHLRLGQKSPYYHYIKCLPKKLDNFPVFYKEQEQKELQGTYFLSVLKRKKIDIKEDFQEILLILPSLRNLIPYEKFVWARLIVSSRIFGVMINEKKTDALVPIADMLNHRSPKMTSWYYCDVQKAFIIQNSNEEIQAGEQIFDSYGAKCNSRFLLNYGFTLPNNEHDQVLIIMKKFKKYRVVAPIIRLTTKIDSDQFRNFISYYRGGVINRQYRDSENQSSHQQQYFFISKDHQKSVWQAVEQTMKQQLQGYPTTIKADQKMLRTSNSINLSANLINCIQMRLGEKRVLEYYIRMAKRIIELFTNSHPRREIDVSQYETYLKDLQLIGTQ